MRIYKEELYLAPWIKWLTTGFLIVVLGAGVLGGLEDGGGDNAQWLGMVLTLVGISLAVALVFALRLTYRIDKDGITYRMFPLEFKERRILWEDVSSLEIFKMKFFSGYTGFGRRRRLFRKEVAYVLNMKYALRVQRKDGKKVVFSTAKHASLIRYLKANHPDMPLALSDAPE